MKAVMGAQAKTPRRRTQSEVRSFLAALLEGDRATALSLAEQFAASRSRVAVFADLLQPAQYEIGERWYRGQIGIAEEHRATAIVDLIVERLPPGPPIRPVPGYRCLLAALGEEQHELGVRMLAKSMTDEGWVVHLLPIPTPVDELLAMTDRLRPDLVGLSAGYLPSIDAVRRAVRSIKAKGIPVLVGGAAFNRVPGLAERTGADGHGVDVRVTLFLARRLAGG